MYIVANSGRNSAIGVEFKELSLVAFPINGFTWFWKLMIEHAPLNPPHTEHSLASWIFGFAVDLADFRYRSFITSRNPMRKRVFFEACRGFNSYATQFVSLESILLLLRVLKLLLEWLLVANILRPFFGKMFIE